MEGEQDPRAYYDGFDVLPGLKSGDSRGGSRRCWGASCFNTHCRNGLRTYTGSIGSSSRRCPHPGVEQVLLEASHRDTVCTLRP